MTGTISALVRALAGLIGARKATQAVVPSGATVKPSILKPLAPFSSGMTPVAVEAVRPKKLAPRPCPLPLSQASKSVLRPA